MQIPGKMATAMLTGFLLASCGGGKLNLKEALPPAGVGPTIRSAPEAGTRVAPGGNAQPNILGITPQADIEWTGFDGEGIAGLENLMAAPKKGPWEESEAVARQTAAREGKPILLWFTDSARSPMCKVLGAELFSTPAFGKWAAEHLVRLRVDANVSADDPNLSLDEKVTRETEMKDYVKRLKKRYRVLGHPSVLMLNPGGEVIARYRGYKRGDADYFWGLIKQGVAASQSAAREWRKNLEAKGYREWEGKRGRKVFAKLASYSDGKLILIEPGGERYRTDESSLSKEDGKWIADQKALRGIE